MRVLFHLEMFTHPAEVCMTYWEHARLSLGLAWLFAKAAVAAAIHAVWPDVLISHSTDAVAEAQKRLAAAGCRN